MPHIEIAAEKLISIFGFPITNTLVTSWVVVGILIVLATLISRRVAIIPGGVQNIFEFFTESFLDLMEGMFGSRENAERYFPIVATIFLFVIISNWLGILPGVGSIGFFEHTAGEHGEAGIKFVPLFRSAASDLNVTLALGIVAVLLVNIAGAQAIGIGRHLGKYFTLKNPIDTFVGLLEFISEFAKIISFSFRLFGNVFAGEVLLVIVGLLVPYGAPIPFLLLEIFVGFIQALVFAMLTMVFISIAVAHH
ncbi:MAG: F0F1 ATP synthase subunit A [bacterium]|nr:F0F1 ATP synthase subunit A [bacterium]MDZ4299612.1 F0F1 ATP synthase subunit A [Candidatus Sungbacteria bacterium]